MTYVRPSAAFGSARTGVVTGFPASTIEADGVCVEAGGRGV